MNPNIRYQIFPGLLSGLAATVPMTVVMQLLHRWPYPERDSLPPHQITQVLAARVGVKRQLDEPQVTLLTLVNHFGFGAGMGSLYSLLPSRIPVNPILKGAGWGMLVWASSYLGWLPAANILSPSTEHSKRRNLMMIIGHLVWGISTALLTERVAPKKTP